MRDTDTPLHRGDVVHFLLFYWLGRLGFHASISTVLDIHHATDIVVSGARRAETVPRIAMQITTAKTSSGKAGRFVEWAGRRFSGPLLFVRCRGGISRPVGMALKAAIHELWADPGWKDCRARGLRLYPDGRRRWFRIPQPGPPPARVRAPARASLAR